MRSDELTTELEALRRQCGVAQEQETCRVLTAIVRWLREHGHGNVRLAAIDHRFSPKVHFDSVVDLARNRN
jgi:hypothetical protein